MLKIHERNIPTSCWNRAKDDEYVFNLLGRDAATPATIRFWVDERIRLGKNSSSDSEIQEALIAASLIEKLQRVK